MKYILFLFSIVLFETVSAQKEGQQLIDSLLIKLPQLKDDSNKAKVLNRIAQTYERINPLKCLPYAQAGLQLSEKLHWKRGIAIFHNNIGLYVTDTGNTVLGRVHFEKSYALNKEMGSKFQQVNNLINIGRSYLLESDFSNATPIFFEALTIAKEMESNDQIAFIGSNLMSVYFKQQNYSKATEYAEMSLEAGKLTGNSRHVSLAFQQLGVIRHMQKDTVGAKMYLEKALKLCEERNDKMGMADALLNLAVQYNDHKKAIEIMLRVNAIMEEINPNSEISIVNKGNLGNAYNQLAKESRSSEKEMFLKKAEEYLLQAKELAEQNANLEQQAHMYFMLADLKEHQNNYKAAFEDYKRGQSINDSLFSQEKKNNIAGLESKYNIALKNKEIAINNLLLINQRRTQIALIAGLILAGIIGGLLYWQSRNRKKTNTTLMVLNNQLDEANKVKAKFFGILSHDLRSPVANLVSFLQLQKNEPGLLNEEQRLRHQQKISDSAEDLLNNMESMLLWSKEQMENFKPQIKNIAVSDLFDYLQSFFPQNGNVKISFLQDPGLTVSADENYLRVIMQNLTSNAIKAVNNSPDGIIEWSAKKEGDKTILAITDNGPGINEEQMKALYDGNNIADNRRSGFGFHLIQDLAKAIQYKILVQSQPGIG
ncbi:MAG TPA: tetratricopeptide repeat-containing sensor histidine kinase, partial [Flavitalea sp.]|nr:tetratricopeptide repeat-containing sensor histidine kinase [Flavitalea sp.]